MKYLFLREFYPRNNSGGPSRSIYRLLQKRENNLDITIVLPYKNSYGSFFNEEYISILQFLLRALMGNKIELVHFNSLWNPKSTLLPLIFSIPRAKKILISPRGELFEEAINQRKSNFKKVLIKLYKIILPTKRTIFLATDKNESKVLRSQFGDSYSIKIFSNISAKPSEIIINKTNKLKCISLGRSSKIKNFHNSVKTMAKYFPEMIYHLYLIKNDKEIFEEIKRFQTNKNLIKILPPIQPEKVDEIIKDYSVMIAISESENFGHSIAESLSRGIIVITSPKTPWSSRLQNLNKHLIVNPNNLDEGLKKSIDYLLSLDSIEILKLRKEILSIYNLEYMNQKLTKEYEKY